MNKILGALRLKEVEVYMDDIIIHAKTKRVHNELLYEVTRRPEKYHMRVNPKKTQLSASKIHVLGIDGELQVACEIKKNEALEFPIPTNVYKLRRLLGLIDWFRQFIKDYA
jgi:hypothetical protein